MLTTGTIAAHGRSRRSAWSQSLAVLKCLEESVIKVAYSHFMDRIVGFLSSVCVGGGGSDVTRVNGLSCLRKGPIHV